MNKIYIVIESGGEYEDKWERNVFATLDKNKAEQYIETEKLHNSEHKKRLETIRNWQEDYDNNSPEIDYSNIPEPLERVRWPSGLKEKEITQEMRDKRKRIQDHNDKVSKLRQQRNNQYYEERDRQQKIFITSMNIPEEEHESYLRWSYYEESYFNIQELEIE